MGSRSRIVWLALGLLGTLGLVLAAWLSRADRHAASLRAAEARVEANAATASGLAPASAPAETRREEQAPEPEPTAALGEDVAAAEGALLLGNVVLPDSASAHGKMGDVRVWWTYEHGVARAGSLATLPPVTPDARGRFRIEELPLDVPLVLWAHTSFGPEAGRALAPFTAGERREVELPLVSWVAVSGVVLGEDSLPLASVVIRASRQSEADPAERGGPRGAELTRQSGADGSFELRQLTSASWLLDFDRPLLAGEPLVDAHGGDVQGLVFVLARPNCVRVVVRWPDGSVAEEALPARISLGNGSRAKSERDGWSFCDLPPGEHEFLFQAEREDGGGTAIAAARVQLPGPERLELVLHEPARVSLLGTVRDELGRVVPGARVQAHSHGQDRQEVEASDGLFELVDLEEGFWTVQAFAEGLECAPRHLLVDALTRPQDFVLTRETRLSGRVLDSSGQPVVGASVHGGGSLPVSGQTLVASGAQLTNEQGEFAFPARSGKLVLTASAKGHASSLPLELVIAPGETRSDVVLHLRPACSLLARVLDARGEPVAGATLSLVGRVARFETDTRGEATLTDQPPGRYTLRTEATGFLSDKLELDLRPGPTPGLEIVLKRPTTTRP